MAKTAFFQIGDFMEPVCVAFTGEGKPLSVDDVHMQLIQQIIEERRQEMAESILLKRMRAELAKANVEAELEAMEVSSIDKRLARVIRSEATDTRIRNDAKSILIQKTPVKAKRYGPYFHGLDLDKALMPKETMVLYPSWIEVFCDDDALDQLTGASCPAPDMIRNPMGCSEHYLWAAGEGSGIAGTGAGRLQSWVEFGFWFCPKQSRFHDIRPMFRLKGQYELKADNRWYNSKYAQVNISTLVNVYQHNWKGWSHVSILKQGAGDVNGYKEIDVDRCMYTSHFLKEGKWVFIRCTVGLDVYARGSGSFAKLDFSLNGKGFLAVPYVHVY